MFNTHKKKNDKSHKQNTNSMKNEFKVQGLPQWRLDNTKAISLSLEDLSLKKWDD
jgi:hypothetical protein